MGIFKIIIEDIELYVNTKLMTCIDNVEINDDICRFEIFYTVDSPSTVEIEDIDPKKFRKFFDNLMANIMMSENGGGYPIYEHIFNNNNKLDKPKPVEVGDIRSTISLIKEKTGN